MAALLFTSLLLAAPDALAQASVDVPASGVTRTKTTRSANESPLAVSGADCAEENDFSFKVNLSGFAMRILEVWISPGATDCTVAERREEGLGCAKLATFTGLQQTQLIELKARELVAQAFKVEPSPTLCTDTQTIPTPQPTTIYFLLLDSPTSPAAASAKWTATSIDLLGPSPPADIRASSAENSLIVSWTVGSTSQETILSYRLYCEPLADGADCASSTLRAGEFPTTAQACGSVTGAITSSGTASGLDNGRTYAVGVAATDLVGNIGRLSDVGCGTPMPVTDFFEAYRTAGGKAGGGFCTFGSRTSGATGLPLLLGLLAALALRRRRALAPHLCAAALLAPTTVSAQPGPIGGAVFDGGFSSGGRTESRPVDLTSRGLYELRLGPYRPLVDDEFSAAGPYEGVFGSRRGLLFGVEADWRLLTVRGIGDLGPGLGAGFTSVSAKAPLSDGSGRSGQETSLSILPLYGVAVARLTVLDEKLQIPLVPYAKAGLGYALWWVKSGNRFARVDGELGRGSSFGPHAALGLMLNLGFFDPWTQAELRRGPGYHSAFVFGEWFESRLNGFDSGRLEVGGSSWVLGMALSE